MNTPAHVVLSLLCLGNSEKVRPKANQQAEQTADRPADTITPDTTAPDTTTDEVPSSAATQKPDRRVLFTPLVIGAILPDAPMFLFYGVEKARGIPDSVIWDQSYYAEGWQNFFDIFNSFPIMALGLGITIWGASRWGQMLFGSMIIHGLGDLPLHHDDGHRHFFPLTNWRFESPISYWDPDHHGAVMTALEILMVMVSAIFLWRNYQSRGGKITLGITVFLYLAYMLPFAYYFFFHAVEF
ncbi:MAG: hypothetical protein ACO4AI_10795 [Prochlorothrix sp.]|nr:hypothetical protein [Prochlorothrix sp.]